MNKFRHCTIRALLLGTILALMSSNIPASEAIHALAPCPASPNCVCSQSADQDHFIEPIHFTGDASQAWKRLKSALDLEHRFTVVEDTGNYLHAEARSLLFRFVDDIEFVLNPDAGVIRVRSASRVGYSDFGVNRRRVERIRKAFNEQP